MVEHPDAPGFPLGDEVRQPGVGLGEVACCREREAIAGRSGYEVERRGPMSLVEQGIAATAVRRPEEIVNRSRSTQRPRRPQRRKAQGILGALCELCVQSSSFFHRL